MQTGKSNFAEDSKNLSVDTEKIILLDYIETI